jgi:SAM-dependent methyltransferase
MCTAPEAVPIHRKVWEFARVIQALQACGVWRADAAGLSVAGGRERFLFYAANHVARIVSTDIYGAGGFAEGEADEGFLSDPAAYAPFPFRREPLRAARMNAACLLFHDGLFDFTVSFSSIEHFGGLAAAIRALQEMVRVTRPGGVIAITTDYSLNGFTTNEIFTRDAILRLAAASGCELAAPLDLVLSPDSKAHLLDMLRDDLARLPHLNLKIYAAIFTSLCLIFRKPGSAAGDGQAPGTAFADRLRAIDAALAAAARLSPETVLPQRRCARRLAARSAQALRGARYRLEERLCDYRSY